MAGEWLSWSVAVAWCVRARALVQRIGEVPNLAEVQWDLCPVLAPGLLVVVPARDEVKTLKPAMETLLAQDYPWLRIIAVDDESEDGTGTLLDELAAAHPNRLSVLHKRDTAEGWVSKTYAMQLVLANSRSDYVLLTDADVWFSPSLLRRALAYAELTGTDHLVVAPTAVTKTWGERTVLGFLQLMALWATRPWRVADPHARMDVAAAGAFNLLRRDALEGLGGLEPQRLAIVEDITLGRRVRAAGLRQHLVFAPGLVLVHWASGAFGIIRGMTKNLFALVNFWASLQMLVFFGLALLFALPLIAAVWAPTCLPALLTLCCIALCFRTMAAYTGIPARYGWLYPLGGLGVVWAMLRSMVVTWARRGVRWRGSFYPLQELRRHNNPFLWEWEAAKLRAERRRAGRMARPSRLLRLAQRIKRQPVRSPRPLPFRNGARRIDRE